MRKLLSIFAIVMILAIVFAGCDNKRVAVETEGFDTDDHIIYETVDTEDVTNEDVIKETTIRLEDIVG